MPWPGRGSGGRTWDLRFSFIFFLSTKQNLRPLGYCAPPNNNLLLFTDLSIFAFVVSVALDCIGEEPILLGAGIGVVLGPGQAKH